MPDTFRHHRFEHALSASRDYADPLEVSLKVEFHGPGSLRQTAEGFWDGGRTWKFRFSPEQSGSWTWRSQSSDADLDGHSGWFHVVDYKGSNPLYLRGAPRLSADRRYFAQADGTPWFWLACTGWNSAILSTDTEWKQYLADRAAKRFTAIQLILHAPWRAGRQDENGEVAFTPGKPLRVNPRFFQRMDRKLDECNEAGLAAAAVVLWALTSRDKESPGAVLPDEDAARLASYMVARYGAHHVLWLLAGDGNYAGENAERWRKIGRAVFPKSRARRPVSLHPGGMRNPWPDLKDEEWLDYLTFQTGHGSDERKWRWNATIAGELSGYQPVRPVLDAEPNYEGHLSYQAQKVIDDFAVRKAVYYSLLSGPPAGITYGAHGIWAWARKREVPLDHPRTGEADPWRVCLNYPGAQQMKVLRDIFDRFEWWTLRPDRTLLAEEPAFEAYPMPAWSEKGKFALIYFPSTTEVRLNLGRLGGKPTLEWMDPRTGARQAKPAGGGDWLLLIR
ncbi:MAG: DUF4038 domain-containing protein [Acidimicrobiia bacterium]|nr:DUF4038 domain-containing protein [Acidimicrobiia bacterium]